MSRDRDVRNAMQSALQGTGAFDGVYVWGLPEDYGSGSSNAAIAVIEPVSTTERDEWDSQAAGGILLTSHVTLTLIYRAEDPQLRDEAAELLVDTAANALNGQSLAGLTLPAWTKITSWRWEKPAAPERRITCDFTYQYIVEGWNDFDTTE